MKRETLLAKNTAIISFGTFLPKVLATISLPIVTAQLTKTEYGIYDLINILESLFLPLITLQIQTAAFRFLIECRNEKNKQKTIVTTMISFLFCTSLFSLIVLFLCLHNTNSVIRILICVYFFMYIILNAEQQIERGLSENITYSLSAIISSIVNVLLIVIFVQRKGLGLVGLMLALVVSTISAVLFIFIKGKLYNLIDMHFIDKNILKKMLKFSWPMIPNSLSMWAMNLSDRLVLTAALGIEATAVYAVANKIPSLFTVVQSTFTLAWQENASIVSSDTDAGDYYSNMFDVVYCLMTGVLSILIAVTPFLFKLLIRGDYIEAYFQMPILFMGVFFSCIVSYLGGIYVAHKKTKSVGITTIIAAVMNLVINLLLVRWIGIYAASVSTLISFLFLTIYRMFDVQKFEKIYYKWKKIILSILILICMCIMCFLRSTIFDIINYIIAILITIFMNQRTIKSIYLTTAKFIIRRINK